MRRSRVRSRPVIINLYGTCSADGLDTTCADRIALPAFVLPAAPAQ